MKLFFTCCLWLVAVLTMAQNQQEQLEKAQQHYRNGQYAEAANIYARAAVEWPDDGTLHYHAACAWAMAGDTIQSIQHLQSAVELGWFDLRRTEEEQDLKVMHQTKGWQQVLDGVKRNKSAVEKNYNIPLKERLERMLARDQTLRQLYREAEKKFGKKSDEMRYFWKLMAQEDSVNVIEVVDILAHYGWVGNDVVGDRANTVLWLVIQHASLDIQTKYLPLLRASVKEGVSQGQHLALLEDRILMRNGKPQIYGSQVVTNSITGKREVYALADSVHVDERRHAVGLGNLADYLKRYGIDWN